MRHPFDGIIIPEKEAAVARGGRPAAVSRRSLLGRIFGGGVALVGMAGTRRAFGAEAARAGQPEPRGDSSYRLYYVVPKDPRKFLLSRRKQLGVLGDKWEGIPANRRLQGVPGYLAWLEPAEAERVALQADVDLVYRMGPQDVWIEGLPPAGRKTLRISLAPNDWIYRPRSGTYATASQLATGWSKQFARQGVMRLTVLASERAILASLGPGEVPQEVLEEIKAHPQVYRLAWLEPSTTSALGEEGGNPFGSGGPAGGLLGGR